LVRHFDQLPARELDRLFGRRPQGFSAASAQLGYYLGATLYMKGTRLHLAEDLARQRARGTASIILDLEDAIADDAVVGAQAHIIEQLRTALAAGYVLPLVFVRVRHESQISEIACALGAARSLLSGFVLPKFDSCPADGGLDQVAAAGAEYGHRFLAMPVLEGRALAYRETRASVLAATSDAVAGHADLVPVVRIGATDISGVFGLRRPPELTVYDLAVVRDVICDIVNTFARPGSSSVISGCVWEYFTPAARVLKPELRSTPFTPLGRHGRDIRDDLLATDSDALIKEVVLDKANGLVGKTVIHPSHISVVHSLMSVSAEEYADAICVLGSDGGGASSSDYGNKMNELGPHRAWAQRISQRADAFGVLAENVSFADLLISQADHQG
jgi:citrate lyase beta subunit